MKTKILRRIYSLCVRKILHDKQLNHVVPSAVYSPDNDEVNDYLVQIISQAGLLSSSKKLNSCNFSLPDAKFFNVFPGEHYRLLNSLIEVTQAKNVVEIGTSTGLGTLACAEVNSDVQVTTFDIVEWDKLHLPTHLSQEHFKNGRIKQIIGDLSLDDVFIKNKSILDEADIIFMDAPKDNIFEYKMIKNLMQLKNRKNRLLIIDDIRFINMIDLWRSIQSPKIDATTFGHWSGTGIVDIKAGLKLRSENL
jgi:predicted O-methyltransferase YrrM